MKADLVSSSLLQSQDGLYLQATYGIMPRFRVGLRGDLLGLINKQTKPSGEKEKFDQSYRFTTMIDYTLTEFSRLRLQANHGRYDLQDDKENVSEVFLQAVFSIGAHGAHRF